MIYYIPIAQVMHKIANKETPLSYICIYIYILYTYPNRKVMYVKLLNSNPVMGASHRQPQVTLGHSFRNPWV